MLFSIMKFLNRREELDRLRRLPAREEGGLAVVYGRRRIGKTRLLLEWAGQEGIYCVADQSSPPMQRRAMAETLGTRFKGFADVEYRDWRSLLTRLARDAATQGFRGPLILDEFPYLAASSPEFPSVLQSWIDHDARAARLAVAIAGSSQRMMQGLVLAPTAPLYGRAHEVIEVRPLSPRFLPQAFAAKTPDLWVEIWTCWGGVPRYWELTVELPGTPREHVERIVLNPLGALHEEPDRLLLDELPPAVELRPLLDAIGSGAHRVSEIAGRLGRPATSMARPIERLVALGLARREIPFGESEKKSRRALYKIADPFLRLWFRVVAPHRGQLAQASPTGRLNLLDRTWSHLVANAFEDLCRQQVPQLPRSSPLGRLGPWGPASRWWQGNLPEWDIVSESMEGDRLLVGEVKWSARPLTEKALRAHIESLRNRDLPSLPSRYGRHEVIRALFVPEASQGGRRNVAGVRIVHARDLFA